MTKTCFPEDLGGTCLRASAAIGTNRGALSHLAIAVQKLKFISLSWGWLACWLTSNWVLVTEVHASKRALSSLMNLVLAWDVCGWGVFQAALRRWVRLAAILAGDSSPGWVHNWVSLRGRKAPWCGVCQQRWVLCQGTRQNEQNRQSLWATLMQMQPKRWC